MTEFHLDQTKSFLRYAIFLSVFDVWFHIWLNRDPQMILDFVMVWISLGLAHLVTYWFFVPFHRNCVAFALLSLVMDVAIARYANFGRAGCWIKG